MKKKKRDNRLLCYIGLFVLVFFLLLPPGLRIFGKKLYVNEEVKKDEVIVLKCNKTGESISSTFLNYEPQNIEYIIQGDLSVNVSEESKKVDQEDNSILNLIKPYSQINYDQKNNQTSFRVKVIDLKALKDYAILFGSLENQKSYFNSQAFYCDKMVN